MRKISNEAQLAYILAKKFVFDKIDDVKEFTYNNIRWDLFIHVCKEQKTDFLLNLIDCHIPHKFRAEVDMLKYIKCAKINLQLKEYSYIKEKFDVEGIDIIWMKGIPLGKVIYDDIYLRYANDMDFLIKNEKIPQAYYILRELGYLQVMGVVKQANRIIAFDSPEFKFSGDYHELSCFKEIADRIYLLVELKRATSGIEERRIRNFYDNTMEITIEIRK